MNKDTILKKYDNNITIKRYKNEMNENSFLINKKSELAKKYTAELQS